MATELMPNNESTTLSLQVVQSLTRLSVSRKSELDAKQLEAIMYCLRNVPMDKLLNVLESWSMGLPAPGVSMEQLKFFPQPNQLVLAVSLLATGQTSEEAWEWVLVYLKRHGVNGEPMSGKFIYNNVRPQIVDGMEPSTPAPAIPPTIHYAVERLGSGDFKKGLTLTMEHPWFCGYDQDAWGRESPFRVAESIESKFREAYQIGSFKAV
jgi:hypothetical protein